MKNLETTLSEIKMERLTEESLKQINGGTGPMLDWD